MALSYLPEGKIMFERDPIVYSQSGQKTKPSPARTVQLLSSLPRDKPELITSIQKDMDAIIQDAIACVKFAIRVQLRGYGHAAITEDLPLLQQNPDEYPEIAHQSYIKRITTEVAQAHVQILCAASRVRNVFTNIEFSDDDMRKIMHNAAAQVERTPDEPKLVVKTIDGDIVVTFAI